MEMDMYAETLIEAYEHPKNKGALEKPTVSMDEENISCGDKITVYLEVDAGRIKEIKFQGSGCIISMASAELLMDELRGKSLDDVKLMTKGDLLKIINIDPGPVRMHCATLALRAIKKAVFAYLHEPLDSSTKEL